MTVERMEIKDGKPVPTGEFETLEADSVILALGQATETGFLKGSKELNLTVTEP